MLVVITLLGLIASYTIRRLVLAFVIALELLLLAIVIANIESYMTLDENICQLLVAVIITIGGSESTCALALVISHYSQLGTISIEPNQ